jgi:septal ring factor EnvC (AmiA/AmiB activator)
MCEQLGKRGCAEQGCGAAGPRGRVTAKLPPSTAIPPATALPPYRLTTWAALSILILAPTLLAAQTPEINASRRRLDSIRVERQRLEGENQRLQGRVKDVGAELRNIVAQQRSTNTIINEIDRQIGGLNYQVDRVSAEAALAQDNMVEAQAILERRLVDIYKRGAMYAWQVLLSAESFGDLISRYKYLYLTSRHDRALLTEVEDLRDRVATRRNELLGLRTTLDRSRSERDAELNRYTSLANTSERRLRQLQRSGQETERQLTQLERDEEDLNQQITTLIATARAAGASRLGTITTADIGKLDWPVEGRIVFNFGRDPQPDGVVLRHNGIGIGAAEGTPVRAIAGGTVVRIQRWSTYGLLVLVDHGAEHYSLYAQLGQALVGLGDPVTKGQAVGTVGSATSEYGSHLHFEIRGAQGIALDPTAWLRAQSN